MAELAAENNVAIEVNFREILNSSKNTRANIMHKIKNNVELCKKYNVPVVICSGAVTHWQLRDPKVLISMGCLLGLELNEAKKAMSEVPENIIKMVKERQDEKWIRPGVKVV
jgi:ribonuclease P/MRP protein subunit RPP1